MNRLMQVWTFDMMMSLTLTSHTMAWKMNAPFSSREPDADVSLVVKSPPFRLYR